MRTAIWSGVFLISAELALLGGCASGPSQQDACAALAQATCDALQRCNSDLFQRTYPDAATCVARQQLSCSTQFPPNSNTTTQNFVDCAGAIPGAACSQILINQTLVLTNLAACRPAPGNQDNGTLCFADSQCKSTYCDKGPLNGLCGACAQRALLNEDCDATACDFGLICGQQNGAPNRCAMPFTAGLNQSCDQTARCQSGLLCSGQKCTPILKAGDACQPGQGSDACDRTLGLFCDQNTQKCLATQYVKPGGACGGAVQSQRTTCTASSKCVNDQVCLGPAGDGQSTTYNCLPPAIVANGVCVLPDPLLCK
jgi:hypothetical protein